MWGGQGLKTGVAGASRAAVSRLRPRLTNPRIQPPRGPQGEHLVLYYPFLVARCECNNCSTPRVFENRLVGGILHD